MTVVLLTAFVPSVEASGFGFRPGQEGFDVRAIGEGGQPDDLAGSHPYELQTTIRLNLAPQAPGQSAGPFTEGDLRDLEIEEPPGMIENPDAVGKCTQAQFDTPRVSPFEPSLSGENCPPASQVGVVTLHTPFKGGTIRRFGVFDLEPPPGIPAQLGFAPYGVPITLDSQVRDSEGSYGISLQARNFSQRLDVSTVELTLWGTPWGVSHNGERGNCLNEAEPSFPWAKCSVGSPAGFHPLAYLTLPTSCDGPLLFKASADSWQQPTVVSTESVPRDSQGAPLDLQGCEDLHFETDSIGYPTDTRASSPSGFEFQLTNNNEHLTNPIERASSQVKKAVIDLPEGVTLNPSVGAGLRVCTPSQYAAETATSPPGAGCPNASKIGSFTVKTPLFEETLTGAIYLAQPYHNPSATLLALYLVAKASTRAVLVKVPGRLDPNPITGRLIATFDDLPQLPYTDLQVHFREGQRAPLVTPPTCGTAITVINLTPWLGGLANLEDDLQAPIDAGSDGGPCPSGAPPFTPRAVGGSINPNAGFYTPFYLHLTRTDPEQEITSYSATLPPGLLGKIAGIPYCPDAAIEAAKRRSGVEELEIPSCPAASEIGHTVSGYGVGSSLAYAPGRLYLAGPYHGSSLSVVAVDSALVGPFDLGVIIVRSAIEVNPYTAQISIDSSGSDPIPHIIDGIPIHLRDVRVYISRPQVTINPTNCEPLTLSSTLTGSSAPFANPDDITATATVPYQVSYCSSLDFRPKLSLSVSRGLRRGDLPKITAHVKANPGDANIAATVVTLPPSLFLEQGHIRAICHLPQLRTETCPPDSVYGRASVTTPLLAQPMRGPVYLAPSSTDRKLPELVVDLRGQGIRILLTGYIHSAKDGGLRATFEGLPDAPIDRFTLTMYGGKRGVLIASSPLCAGQQLASVRLIGQSNAGEAFHSPLNVPCQGSRRRHR